MSPSKEDTVEEGVAAPAAAPPKISMKGFSLNAKAPSSKSISFATKPVKTSSPSTTTLGKRPRSALHAGSDDEDDDEDNHHHGRHEEVTGFDIRTGGAVRKRDEERRAAGNGTTTGPLVIPKQKTRNFREEIRRARGAKNLLPPEVQEQMRRKAEMEKSGGEGVNGAQTQEVFQQETPKWGLTVTKKVEEDVVVGNGDANEGVNGTESVNVESSATTTTATTAQEATDKSPPPGEKTDDELALEALLGKSSTKTRPDLIIPLNDSTNSPSYEDDKPLNETDTYRRAIALAPDVSTLEDYERVPVEEFGAALLRGMGWKGEDSKTSSKRPKEVKRRQNLLGLGAKELKEAEELGAWVQHSDARRLNSGGGKRSGGGEKERRPRASEYREREERRREERDERVGSYRRERERESGSGSGGYRDRERERERDRRR